VTIRFAFVGFRHAHIFDMYDRCRRHAEIKVVAACEEDPATRAELTAKQRVELTHASCAELLANVDCDVIAVGDAYVRRAELILAALNAGRHVLSDKPPCLSLEQLDRIELAARRGQRVVSCMLDMRDLSIYLGLRDAILAGRIGTVHAVSFEGQHPLLYGQRPMWYFEPGCHGGVFNDIAIHALDFVSWATGKPIDTFVAARGWNATVPQHPHFQQCGQAMYVLDGGAGVICDVSYLTPDSFGYRFPHYWRFTFWGSDGVLEASANSSTISLLSRNATVPEELTPPAGRPGGYLDSFLREISGQSDQLHLSSTEALKAARLALTLQQVADQQLHYVTVK
jgi:predicted dehydrogenase